MLKNQFIFRMFPFVIDILMYCNLKCLHVEGVEHKHFTAVRIIATYSAANQYVMQACTVTAQPTYCTLMVVKQFKK